MPSLSWPLVSDFSRMLQNPAVAFRDPALRSCRIEMDNLGQPKPRSGNFATVYRGYRQDGTELAIRVFNRRADLRREHYQAVGKYLEGRSVMSLVDFEYDEKGIRSASDGKLYPLLTMEWVPGVTLFEWVRDRCREGYREALAIGADVWLHLVRDLAAGGVVHGDLQHANVMVTPEGHFKLVDYDCMCAGELMGTRNLETGMEPYQHPARNAETLVFPGLDHFSALVIYVALRALAAAPHLWTTYVDQSGYDKLLFRKEDFGDPAASLLYTELMNSPDAQVRDLTHYLFELTRYELQDVPPIDEVLLWCNSIEELLAAQDWDKAVQLVQRMGPQEEVPADLQPLVQQARRRVACRANLEAALRRGDEREIQRCYVPELLDDYPAAAPLVEQARQSAQVVQVLEVLAAAQRFQNWDVFKNTWQANYALLSKRISAKPFKKEMKRLTTVDVIAKLLRDDNSDDEDVIEAWRHLRSLGGHPSAAALEPGVARRIRRRRALWKFRLVVERAGEPPTPAYDKRITSAWEPKLFGGWNQAAAMERRYQAAATRLDCLRRLSKLAKQCTPESEKEFVAAARILPETYHPALPVRIERARRRLAAFQRLERAMSDPPSDVVIVDAWSELVQAKGKGMVSAAQQERIDLAEKRTPLVRLLRGLSADGPAPELDRQLLDIWDESLLDDCHDARHWAPLYRQALRRQELLAKLEQAVADADPAAVAAITADPALSDYPLPPAIAEGIEQIEEQLRRRELARRQDLLDSVLQNDRFQFARLFDAELLREICEKSPHHRAVVCQATESEILPPDRIGLAKTPENTLERIDPTTYCARWIQPPARVSSRCRLAVCRELPKPHADLENLPVLYSATVDRRPEAVGGAAADDDRGEEEATPAEHRFTVDPEWVGSHVLVWALVDLGFQVLSSEPLELGRIEAEPKKRAWRLFRRNTPS